MKRLNQVAKQARILAYKDKIKQKLASKIIDFSKEEFAWLQSHSLRQYQELPVPR